MHHLARIPLATTPGFIINSPGTIDKAVPCVGITLETVAPPTRRRYQSPPRGYDLAGPEQAPQVVRLIAGALHLNRPGVNRAHEV
jgi:hypothetical protein